MEEADKARLLEEFRQCLDGLDAAAPAEGSRDVDLYSLFSELAALRTEVRAESRWFSGALDDLREAHTLLKDNQSSLDRLLDRFGGELAALRRVALRPVLLDLLDVHDRLSAGAAALQRYRPVKGWFRIKTRPDDRRFIDSIGTGQGMTLRRLDELLARQDVRPMAVLGQPVDPHTMKVVEVEADTRLAPGRVTGELRRGFLWGEEVLRLAEVRARP